MKKDNKEVWYKKYNKGIWYIIGISILFVLFFCLCSCTKNERVKRFGGNMEIVLKSNEKLVNITWKDNDLWVLTCPGDENFVPKTYTFDEKSKYGILEGSIIIIEQK